MVMTWTWTVNSIKEPIIMTVTTGLTYCFLRCVLVNTICWYCKYKEEKLKKLNCG